MLRTLIDKEIRDLVGSAKFAITFGACAFLIVAAFFAGAERYRLYRTEYETANSENMRQIGQNSEWFSVGEARAFLPPEPLSTLVSGVSNDIGRTAVVRGRGEPTVQDSRFNENPIFAVFRFLDLEFLFAIILSLFAILLGYDSVSGEKERGTLRLSFANAVPRHTYLLGKIIGAGAVLTVSLLVAMAVGALLLPLMGVSLSGSEWLRLGLIILAGLLYFGAFLTLSVFVSASTQRSSNSFMIMLTVWIAAVLIIPRVAVLTAGRAVEVPSVDQIAAQKAGYASQLRNEYYDAVQEMKIDLSDPDNDPITLLNRYMDSLHGERDAKQMEFSGRLNEERHNRQDVQNGVAFALARLSPMTSLTLAVSGLANTSVSLKDRFYREAMAYSDVFGDFKKEKTGFNTGGAVRVIAVGAEPGDDAEPRRIDPQEMPVFSGVQSGVSETVAGTVADIGLLAVFNLVFFAAGLFAFGRYDLR